MKKALVFRRSNFYARRKQVVSRKKRFNKKIKKSVFSNTKSVFHRLAHLRYPNTPRAFKHKLNVVKNNQPYISTNQLNIFIEKLFELSPSSGIVLQLFSNYNKILFRRHASSIKDKYNVSSHTTPSKKGTFMDITNKGSSTHRMNTLTKTSYDRINYIKGHDLNGTFSYNTELVVQKFNNYKKLAFSLRFGKTMLPRSFRYANKKRISNTNQ